MPCVALPRCAAHIEAAVCCGVRSLDGSYERRLFFTYYIRMTVSRNACSQLLVDMSVYCGYNCVWAASIAVFWRLSQAKLCEQANTYKTGVEDFSCWQSGAKMYTLLSGLYKYMFQKDEYCVLILGLDNAGKTVHDTTIWIWTRRMTLLTVVQSSPFVYMQLLCRCDQKVVIFKSDSSENQFNDKIHYITLL